MANSRQKLFDQFLTSGFGQVNETEAEGIKKTASVYDWNYKKFIPQDKNIRILDIGCGLGQFLYWLKENGYNNFLGVDVSQQMVDFCQKNISDKVEKISSIIEFLRDKNEQFDIIVMNDVIEHLEKGEIVDDLESIKAALKVGGKVIVKTNNAAAITGPRIRYEDFTHELGFTEYSLKQIFNVAGYSEVNIHAYDFPRTSIKRWARFIVQSVIHFFWKLIFFFEYTTVPKIVNELIFAVATK